jgi:hypothetical protein
MTDSESARRRSSEQIYERGVDPCTSQISGPKRAFGRNFALRPLPQRTRPLCPWLLAHAILLLVLRDGVPTATERGNQNENTPHDVIANARLLISLHSSSCRLRVDSTKIRKSPAHAANRCVFLNSALTINATVCGSSAGIAAELERGA